jgi:hypothetical protein
LKFQSFFGLLESRPLKDEVVLYQLKNCNHANRSKISMQGLIFPGVPWIQQCSMFSNCSGQKVSTEDPESL